MRFAWFIGAVIAASAMGSWAQSPAPAPSEQPPAASLLRFDASANGTASESPVIQGKRYRVSGPIAGPIKSRGIKGFFRSLGKLFNPLAPAPAEPRTTAAERVSAQAWATTAGWHPGGSSFADPTTHEPTMTLLTVSPKGKQQP